MSEKGGGKQAPAATRDPIPGRPSCPFPLTSPTLTSLTTSEHLATRGDWQPLARGPRVRPRRWKPAGMPARAAPSPGAHAAAPAATAPSATAPAATAPSATAPAETALTSAAAPAPSEERRHAECAHGPSRRASQASPAPCLARAPGGKATRAVRALPALTR